jgi:spore coat polysaccharide biosynthesis protein SpsF
MIVAVVQARMQSTRLPGKVLMPIAGRTMLERVIGRARLSRRIDELVVATSSGPADDVLAAACMRLGVALFRGSEDDVLGRYLGAAVAHGAEVIVRLTSDCPLLDPEVIDLVIDRFVAERPDYASNGLEPGFPRGLDTEVFTREALETAGREAHTDWERVHVTPFIYGHPERFQLLSVTPPEAHADERWTVDTPEDLEFVRAIHERLPQADSAGWHDVLKVLQAEPDLKNINRHVEQKPLHKG